MANLVWHRLATWCRGEGGSVAEEGVCPRGGGGGGREVEERERGQSGVRGR